MSTGWVRTKITAIERRRGRAGLRVTSIRASTYLARHKPMTLGSCPWLRFVMTLGAGLTFLWLRDLVTTQNCYGTGKFCSERRMGPLERKRLLGRHVR